MEALKTLESNDSLQNNPEKQKEAISRETDRLFDTLESPDVSVGDIHFLIDNLSSSNPVFAQNWSEFQDKNSLALQNELSKSTATENSENIDSVPQIDFSKDIIASNEKYSLYVDNFSEKFLDILEKLKDYATNHPEKLTVDVVSIILSGLVAVGTVATVSGTTGMTGTIPSIALAGASFTASDNAIRAFGYGVIGKMGWDEIDGEKSFSDGALEGIGLGNEDLNLETVVTKKGFETLSNTVLFGIFNRTGRISEIGMKALEGKGIQLSLGNTQKVMLEAGKTIPESVFFTYYGVGASAIEDTILKMQEENGLNRDEAIDNLISNLGSITDAETFAHYFMYNLGFISLVKLGGAGWQGKVEAHLKDRPGKVNINSLLENSTKLDMELLRLQEKGYSFNREQNGEIVFYDRNLNRVDVMNGDFANLRTIQESLMVNNLNIQRLLLDDSSNSSLPNSGKGTKAQANKQNIQVKYERLDKLSREAEKQGLSFALNKDTIYDGVSKSGVKEGTKDGLLKEAGFTNSEREAIKKQEPKEGSKKLEDRAVERMNSAVERIQKEYIEINKTIKNLILKGKDPYIELSKIYTVENIDKILKLKESL